MYVRFLKRCTSLSSISICLDVEHLFLEEVRPLLDVGCEQISFEICMGETVEKWTLPRDRNAVQSLFSAEGNSESNDNDSRAIYVKALTYLLGLITISGGIEDMRYIGQYNLHSSSHILTSKTRGAFLFRAFPDFVVTREPHMLLSHHIAIKISQSYTCMPNTSTKHVC